MLLKWKNTKTVKENICNRVHKMVQRAQNNYRIGLNEENGLK